MIRRLSKAIFVLAALSFFVELAWSDNFLVSNATQLQNALTEAATNGEDDTIRVIQGTYTGNFTFDSTEGKNITLLGGYSSDGTSCILDPANTILDGNNVGRVLYINNYTYWGNGEGSIYIQGFTIQNGIATDRGGGLYAVSESGWIAGNVTIIKNVIRSNTASDIGGGLYAASYSDVYWAGTVLIKNNIIEENSASSWGGIYTWTAHEGQYVTKIMDTKSIVKKSKRNSPLRMRAENNEEGDITIINNTVRNNHGGGLGASTNGEIHSGFIYIVDNSITGNTGSGVRTGTWGGSTKISGNIISGNTSLDKGGGVYASSYNEKGGGNIAFINNIISDNSSVEGGGVYTRTNGTQVAGDLYLVNNTITGNLGSDFGGGVCIEYVEVSTLNLYNNIIWDNSAFAGGDIFMKIEPDDLYWIESNGFNNDYSALDGIWTAWGGNIHVNPRFRDPGNDDFHLKSTSPCIDAGTDSAPMLPEDDFDGDPRILDGNDDGTAIVDIGADECVWVPLHTLTIMSSAGGSTQPAPGEHTYAQGTEVTITALPDDHYRFSHWSGDVSGTTNPITITMSADVSLTANFIRIIYPPSNFTGQKVLNRSLSQAEYINVFSWQPDPNNVNIAKYRIYQIEGESRNLLVELNASAFQYWHRRVEKDKQYVYAIYAVNDEGREGDPAHITVQ